MSAAVYSGSAQIAALQAWSSAPLLLPLAATILVMNARYILYGAALRPWLGGLGAHQVYPTLYFLGDGNWALSMKEHAEGDRTSVVMGKRVSVRVDIGGGRILKKKKIKEIKKER